MLCNFIFTHTYIFGFSVRFLFLFRESVGFITIIWLIFRFIYWFILFVVKLTSFVCSFIFGVFLNVIFWTWPMLKFSVLFTVWRTWYKTDNFGKSTIFWKVSSNKFLYCLVNKKFANHIYFLTKWDCFSVRARRSIFTIFIPSSPFFFILNIEKNSNNPVENVMNLTQ